MLFMLDTRIPFTNQSAGNESDWLSTVLLGKQTHFRLPQDSGHKQTRHQGEIDSARVGVKPR